MINKKNLWFLTLFSLVLVLSIYYITMPSELLLTSNNNEDDVSLDVSEASVVEVLKETDNNSVLEEIASLKETMTNDETSTEDKNKAFDMIKLLNQISSKETLLEEKIKDNFNLESFVKIEDDNVRVVIESDKHDNSLANEIMRTIQSNFDTKKYIAIEFK